MALYKGVCGELVPVACAEDFSTRDNQWWAEIGFDSEDGVEYFLRFDGFLWENNGITWTANGAFCLQAFPGNVNGIDELEPVSLTAFPNPSVGGSVSLSWPGMESVADVAVFGIPHPEFGEEVMAVVQPLDWAHANADTEAELIEWMRERLSSVKVPRKVDFLEQLPRMDNGKLYKRHLQDAYREAV